MISIPPPFDIRNLEFAKAKFNYIATHPDDLSIQKGDLVAILERKVDGDKDEWWRGRNQEGKIGIFPSSYVAIIPKKKESSDPAARVAGASMPEMEQAFTK
jgi:hypothetical protein